MNIEKLMNRNFSLMIVGQIISLFGNAILRFSLSLYVLDMTGSAAAFGGILAISIIPTILLAPFGGILADRMSRKYIMLILDFLTAALIFIFSLFATQDIAIVWIGVVMIVLSIIQSFYQPSVQASIPLLVAQDNLMKANGIVVQVNALANLLGPILGSVLFTILPFVSLLWIAAGSFFFSAILECIMQIPYTKTEHHASTFTIIKHDLKEGMHFITKEQPILWKLLFVLASLNLVLSSFLTVGLPVISNITLHLPPAYYGVLQAGIGIGSILGSLFLPYFQKRYNIKRSYLFLILASICILPIAISLSLSTTVYMKYAIILTASILSMAFAAIFNIYAQTFLQQQTPNHLLGKVSSFVTMIVMCSYPIGQSIYGALFDTFDHQIALIVGIAALLSLLISYLAKNNLNHLKNV